MTVQIGNVATTDEGLAIDRVLVFSWLTGDLVTSQIPAVDGSWSASILEQIIGVTYLAQGKIPQTHGPYDLVPSNAVLIGDTPIFINDDVVLIG